jgi:Ser/Thr protein kinase RdoA (MazF antagonist)
MLNNQLPTVNDHLSTNLKNMPQSVLPFYGLKEKTIKVEAFGSGLINSTWKVSTANKDFILQRVNNTVFEYPKHIANNLRLIADYFKKHHPEYCFVAPITSSSGDEMVYLKDRGFFRLFPFIPGSHSKNVVTNPAEAYEAATQFGRFTRLLNDFDVTQLKITIPGFHDLSLRYQQFLSAQRNGNKKRIAESEKWISILTDHSDIVKKYEQIKSSTEFKLRVTHHDTKISNVLFDKKDQGICVIDLDTVMPGYFISDVGDMMRTYLSPVSEEEKDFDKIEVREDFYKAIVHGYFNEMKEELTEAEKSSFFDAGKFMIYMQALRFLTDHINDDIYYAAKYEGHNLVRAGNQVTLLQRLMEKELVLAKESF